MEPRGNPAEGAPQQSVPHQQPPQSNVLAIVGLVASIVGLLLCWVTFVGMIIAVAGLVVSIMGSKKAKELGGAGKGPAVGGIVVGIFGILFGGAVTTCQLACGFALNKAGQEMERMEHDWEDAGKQLGQEFEEAFGEAAKQMEEAQREIEEQQKEQEAD